MDTEPLDLEKMLSPISGDQPCGEDLRTSQSSRRLFDDLKDARRGARDIERGAPDPGKDQPEDYYFQESLGSWRKVRELAPKILAEYSKDLEVASLFIEAEVRLNSFAGLRDGFRLVRKLIDRYWECLHPMPDEDGIISRVASLASLNGEGRDGTLIGPILRVPLTDAAKASPVAHWQWIRECELPSLPEEKNAGYERLKRLASETEPAFFEKIRANLESCQQEFSALTDLLNKQCNQKLAPPSSNIRAALENCRGTLRILSNESEQTAPAGGNTGGGDGKDTMGRAAGDKGQVYSGEVVSREGAFQKILEIAGYFRRAEPHSPVSYTLEQAVRWGRMPLDELLNELIADEKARAGYRKLAGITATESKKESE